LVGNNLCCLPSDSILVIVGTDLQAPFYCNEAAFRQMIGTDLCLLSPRHDINEISFPLATLAYKGTIHCKGEIGYRNSRLSITELWISYQSPN